VPYVKSEKACEPFGQCVLEFDRGLEGGKGDEMPFRVMDKRSRRVKIIHEQEALEMGFLVTPFGKLLRVRWAETDEGGIVGYPEEISEEDFGILRVIGCG